MNKIVAIDGPAGSGKGTLASIVSKACNLVNIDTGATYRCVALKALRNNLKVEDKEEIIKISRQINTFEISIQPYEDCCTVFTPKHPKTKPILADIEKAEEPLDIDALCEEAFNGIKKIFINSDGVQNG